MLIKFKFHISWLRRISFIYNPTASFFRHDLESNSKWGPYYSRNIEIFSILILSSVQSNLLVWIKNRKLVLHKTMALNNLFKKLNLSTFFFNLIPFHNLKVRSISCKCRIFKKTSQKIKRKTRPDIFLRKGVLKICSKFTGEHPCRSVISKKFQRMLNPDTVSFCFQ